MNREEGKGWINALKIRRGGRSLQRGGELDSAVSLLSHRCETDAKRNETISPGDKIKLKMKLKDDSWLDGIVENNAVQLGEGRGERERVV